MEEYVGKICPYCKREIKEGEAVKVCPSCAIPHHESCWEANKGCTTFGCPEQHFKGQNSTNVCPNCGTPFGDGQMFCPRCGTPKSAVNRRVCDKCGAELQEGQDFCPKCGQKVGLAVDAGVNSATVQKENKKKSKKIIVLPIVLGVVVVAAIALFFLLKGPSVDKITLSESTLELKTGDSITVSYTITPREAKDVDVTWESSDKSVATVNSSGKITGKGDGTCTITVTAGEKSDRLDVTVKSGPNFQEIFNKCGLDSSYASVASDGSYLSIDTNPNNEDDYLDFEACDSLPLIHAELGLPDSLMEDMNHTRSIDGKQTEVFEDVTVTWTFHPDQGLEVTYKAN